MEKYGVNKGDIGGGWGVTPDRPAVCPAVGSGVGCSGVVADDEVEDEEVLERDGSITPNFNICWISVSIACRQASGIR